MGYSNAFPGVSLPVSSYKSILHSVPRMEFLTCKQDHVSCLLEGWNYTPFTTHLLSTPPPQSTSPPLPSISGSGNPDVQAVTTHHTLHPSLPSFSTFALGSSYHSSLVPSAPPGPGATTSRRRPRTHLTALQAAPAGCSHRSKIYGIPARGLRCPLTCLFWNWVSGGQRWSLPHLCPTQTLIRFQTQNISFVSEAKTKDFSHTHPS